MNKKGTHVGFVLSFTIFVLFIVFLFAIIQPTNRAKDEREFVLEDLSSRIVRNVTSNLTTFSLRIDDSVTEDIVEFNPPVDAIDSIVKDENNNKVQIGRKGTEEIIICRQGENFFKFFIAKNIPRITGGACDSANIYLSEGDYDLGKISSNQYVLEWFVEGYVYPGNYPQFNTKGLVEYYNEDYENLKRHFRVPDGNNFYFIFTDADGDETKPDNYGNYAEIPENVEVFSKRTIVNYVDKEANIKTGTFDVQIW